MAPLSRIITWPKALRGQAIFDGGATYDIAHLKVYDPEHDLAVLKITSSDTFATVQLGDSSGADVRDRVLTAGNGLCQGLAATEGNIRLEPVGTHYSARRRGGKGDGRKEVK